MLVQFSVENFLSFDEEQIFSMVATADDQHPKHVVSNVPRKGESVLRGAALYGANAAGKSNLVEAIRFAQRLILDGTRSGQALPFRPFKLKPTDRPSKFEFIIQAQGVLYNYGFRADAQRVHEEWLYATPDAQEADAQEVRYFERMTHVDGRVEIEFGPSFIEQNSKREQFVEFVAEGTRPNQPFLTEAMERNVAEITPVVNWFRNSLIVIPTETVEMNLALRVTTGPDFAQFLGTFLREAGTGIDRVEAVPESEPVDLASDFPAYNEPWREAVRAAASGSEPGDVIGCLGRNGEPSQYQFSEDGHWHHAPLKLRHQAEGKSVFFDMTEESDGTRRLMHLVSTLYQMRELRNQVIIIDKLEHHLHPLLSRLFVLTALDSNDEHRHSQLIFTTHDTNLLDLDLLRRDEIWFVEKDKGGASHLYSLVEYKIGSDFKAEKGYLSGRFGALPFFGDPSRLSLLGHPMGEAEAGRSEEGTAVGVAA